MIQEMLILGDFRGGADRKAAKPLARRRTWRIDRDEIDSIIAAMAPEARITLDPEGAATTIRFQSLDDFHPDRLIERVPLLQQLRELRSQLAAPARSIPPDPAPATRADAAAAAMAGGSLLDQILDSTPGVSSRPADELSDFVNRAVRPHVVGDVGAAQKEQLAKVDAAIAAALRVILHDSSFQALESLWRATGLLVRRVDTSDDFHLVLVDVTRSELVAALESTDDERGGLRSLLETPADGGGRSRWSVAIIAHSFGELDIPVIERLAHVAEQTGVPCIAGARPSLAGAEWFGDGTDVDDWEMTPPAAWDALRRGTAARWLSLALPRFLVRVCYGANGEPCEGVDLEEIETDSGPAHESFLWANPALLCALVLGESASEHGSWATQGTVDRMPLQLVRVNNEAIAIPCAETLLSHRSMMHLLDRGLTPLLSQRDGDAIRLPRIQSIAFPPAPLPVGGRTEDNA